jgi:hypothetical protein
MEGCDFEIGAGCYFMFRGLIVAVYFTHIVPFGYLIYVIALILEYWIEKYMLLRKCKIPPTFSRDITDSYMHGLALIPVIYILGVYKFVDFRGYN